MHVVRATIKQKTNPLSFQAIYNHKKNKNQCTKADKHLFFT